MTDYYKTLGIGNNSSLDEIKKAYRKLSRKYHPDNNNGDAFYKNKFKQIQEAYSVLENPRKRTDYDSELKGYLSKQITYNSHSKTDPVITHFKCDKLAFYNGEELKFEWKTINANVVKIKPFGIVNASGSKTFKLNSINKKYVNIEIKATNSITSKYVSKNLIIQNNAFRDTRERSGFNNKTQKKYFSSRTTKNTESFWSINGRLRRKDYLIRLILLNIPLIFLLEFSNASNNEGIMLLLGITVIACFIITAMQTIKRLHDINKSGWWYLIFLAPFANIVFGIHLLITDGTRGNNRYGSDPKKQLKN